MLTQREKIDILYEFIKDDPEKIKSMLAVAISWNEEGNDVATTKEDLKRFSERNYII